jgi:hypothetical protein
MAWNEVGNLRGPGMTYKGNYSDTASYAVGDVVFYSYATWVAKVPTTGVAPATSGTGATKWGQVAARGATGPQGVPGTSVPKYYGVLRWGNIGWYNPPSNQFHRLDATSGALLYPYKSVGNVAQTSGAYARLYIPVSGIWQLSATQTWGNTTVARGTGLATSSTDGAAGVVLWTDSTQFGHLVTSRATYLDAGTYLYAWTWNSGQSGMSWADRGLISEYSAALLQPA